MKTNIIVNLQIEGIHSWPQANEINPIVGFLSNNHRHIFHIECKYEVYHDDRDREFIVFKREINKYLKKEFYDNNHELLNFGAMSCEMIAKQLLKHFNLTYCSVLEDNENGATCEK